MAQTRKEYWSEVRSVYKDPKDYVLAGRGNAYVRIDAEAKVTGTAVYTDDVYLPDTWYCKLVHSPYAHALIKSIDFTEAAKVPGVKGFLTGADFPEGHNLGNPEAFKELADKEPLCRKKVRMVGDEVAAVCATTEEAATGAAGLGNRFHMSPFRLSWILLMPWHWMRNRFIIRLTRREPQITFLFLLS